MAAQGKPPCKKLPFIDPLDMRLSSPDFHFIGFIHGFMLFEGFLEKVLFHLKPSEACYQGIQWSTSGTLGSHLRDLRVVP